MVELERLIEEIRHAPQAAAQAARDIHQAVLQESRWLDAGNFTVIHDDDLRLLFGHYDQRFFRSQLQAAIDRRGAELRFRLSSRMTSSAGKTYEKRQRPRDGSPEKRLFEIAVSSTLLFQTFEEIDRPIPVCGLTCRNRLEALQRIFEHELLHLAELLVWGESSCRTRRFAALASRMFGHTEAGHQLVTPRELALTRYGIRTGSRVRFRFDGIEHVGVVNRITQRATVLVPSAAGRLYSDGRRYEKFYIPLEDLQPDEKPSLGRSRRFPPCPRCRNRGS